MPASEALNSQPRLQETWITNADPADLTATSDGRGYRNNFGSDEAAVYLEAVLGAPMVLEIHKNDARTSYGDTTAQQIEKLGLVGIYKFG